MAIVRITTKLRNCDWLSHGGVRFENGMNVEIVDPALHPKSGKDYFNTSNVKLVVAAFVAKYGSQYSKMSYDFIHTHMIAEVL